MNRPALGLLLLLAACGKKDEDKGKKQEPTPPAAADAAPVAKPTPDAGPAAPAVDPAARFATCLAAFNAHDADKLRACYGPDGIGIAVDSPPELKGADAIVASNQALWQAFPDIAIEPQVILVRGRSLVALLLSHGTNTGAATGAPPPTRAVAGTLGLVAIEYDDAGLAARETQYVDAGAILRQLAKSPDARPPITKGVAEPLVVTSAGVPEHVNTAQAMVAAFNSRDWAAFKATLDPKVVMHDMGQKNDVKGADALLASAKQLVAGASEARILVQGTPLAVGDYVFLELRASGKHDGNWPGLGPASGKAFEFTIGQLMRFAGGKPIEIWRVVNGVVLLQQLGVNPIAPKPMPK